MKLFIRISILLLLLQSLSSFTFKKNDAVNHILNLREQCLRTGEFSMRYFSSDTNFPYATDWMYQDMKDDVSEWFLKDDNSEIKDKVIKKFISVLGKELKSDYLHLKKQEKISDKDWLNFYFDLCEKRRAIRLATIPENHKKLVFTKHFDMGGSHYAYTENPTDARGTEKKCNDPDYELGSALCVFTLENSYGTTEVLESSGSGVIRDPEVSYDGKTILYSKRNSRDEDDYHIYEYNVANRTSRQITFGLGFADVEPVYLPDGNILFNSTRCMQTVDCYWPDVTNMYLSDSDGKYIRRIGYDQVHTNYPKVLANGKVIYTRWDYNDRAQIYPQPLFEMNIDGTRQTEYYGNNSFFPTTIMQARGIPGTNKVLAVLGGHHAEQRGKLAIIDRAKGTQEAQGVQLVAPVRKTEALRIDAYGQDGDQFQYPYPIDNENFFVTYCAYHGGNRNYPRPYGIYWMNVHGERELLVWDANVSCNQQMPLASRNKPPVKPSTVDFSKKTGMYHVKNVYEGPGLTGVKKGTVKALRVVEILYRPAAIGLAFNGRGPGGAGHSMMPVAARHGTWDAKKVLGTVPVNEDGSAFFEVPARTPVYFQLLDSLGDVVQTMRSWSTLQPGEVFSCVGCHEDKNSAPVMGGRTIADKKGPQKLKPFYDVEGGFSYNRVIQPIFNAKCISCHDGKKHKDKYVFSLTNEQYVPGPNLRQFGTDSKRIWSASYMNLTSGGIVHPGETVLNWLDVMDTPQMLKPYYAGSAKSRMMKMLRKGHGGVTLTKEELDKLACWIDLLVPYCGDYDENTNWTKEDWKSYKYYLSKRELTDSEDLKNVQAYIEEIQNSKPNSTTIDKMYQNLALNPNDTKWYNLRFPHATSNSECRGEEAFLAKNAINGQKNNKGHGAKFPSWGPEKINDLWWKVDFGKEIIADKLVLYIRADFPHDKHWHETTIEFSDGSKQKITIEKTSKDQEFKFTGGKKEISWLKLTNFKQTEPLGWCALTEVEVWGWNEDNYLLTKH